MRILPSRRIPYIIRLRQCLVEWATSDYKNGRPLANALKYASAFPVIVFSAFQKVVVEEVLAGKGVSDLGGDTWHGEHPLFRLWYVMGSFHSAFMFECITDAQRLPPAGSCRSLSTRFTRSGGT